MEQQPKQDRYSCLGFFFYYNFIKYYEIMKKLLTFDETR